FVPEAHRSVGRRLGWIWRSHRRRHLQFGGGLSFDEWLRLRDRLRNRQHVPRCGVLPYPCQRSPRAASDRFAHGNVVDSGMTFALLQGCRRDISNRAILIAAFFGKTRKETL